LQLVQFSYGLSECKFSLHLLCFLQRVEIVSRFGLTLSTIYVTLLEKS
jgi:hypothetical protein